MLKVALVGVGGISGAHIPVWEKQENTELVALCDIRPERMEKYSGKRCYTDFEEMLNSEEIDILDICLPTYCHAAYSIKAMERGIHVICEKPISLNKDDVARIYETAEKNNVKFMVAQVLRFWPEYEVVKKLYDEKIYGNLLSGSMKRLGRYPAWSWDGWMMDEKRSGLVPFDLHIHDLDFLVYAFGKPNHVVCHRSKRPEQDYVNAVYEFDSFFISAEASWYASAYPFRAEFLFQFENAVVALENEKLTIYEKDGKTICPVGNCDTDTGNIGLPASNAYGNEIIYFTNCVINNENPDKVRPEELENVIDILNSL